MSGRAIAFSIVIAGILLAMVYPVYKAAQVSNYSSPTIRALSQDLAKGHEEAEAAFWAKVEAQGVPLIELPEKKNEPGLLTFVYRGDDATERVELAGPITEAITDNTELERLGKTSVWFRTYDAPLDFRATYRFLVNGEDDGTSAEAIRDPLNPEVDGDRSVVTLPDAITPTWTERTPPAPGGTFDEFQLQSRALQAVRQVTVYLPPGYGDDAEETYPLLITFDGTMYRDEVAAMTIQNNLVADGAAKPFVHAMLETPPATRFTELGLNDALVSAVCDELLPQLRGRYAISTEAEDIAVGGASLGGVAAAYVGVMRPGAIGNVLAQSGAFWNRRGPDDAVDTIVGLYEHADALPERMYLDAGSREDDKIKTSVSELVEVALNRGVLVRYRVFDGEHDAKGWRMSFGDGVRFLF